MAVPFCIILAWLTFLLLFFAHKEKKSATKKGDLQDEIEKIFTDNGFLEFIKAFQ
jgi:hypothetical protein